MKVSRELLKVVEQGELMPNWYGLSYWKFDMQVGVFYPIPINFVVRWLRDIRFFLKTGGPSWADKKLREAYDAGYSQGYKLGEERGRYDALETVSHSLRA